MFFEYKKSILLGFNWHIINMKNKTEKYYKKWNKIVGILAYIMCPSSITWLIYLFFGKRLNLSATIHTIIVLSYFTIFILCIPFEIKSIIYDHILRNSLFFPDCIKLTDLEKGQVTPKEYRTSIKDTAYIIYDDGPFKYDTYNLDLYKESMEATKAQAKWSDTYMDYLKDRTYIKRNIDAPKEDFLTKYIWMPGYMAGFSVIDRDNMGRIIQNFEDEEVDYFN